VFERAKYRTELVKCVLEKIGESRDMKLEGGATTATLATAPVVTVAR
jgi:hypothetical protein